MAKSEAMKLAQLQARTELASQGLALLTDPLWSTIGGFVAIHYLRKQDLIGPVADDVLYAGVIAINTARQPAMMELAGKGISAAAAAAGAAGGVAATYAAGKVGQKLVSRGKGPVSFSKAMALAAKGGGTLTVLPPMATNPDLSKQDEFKQALQEGKWWQIWRAI
jgi:hypothetical protein